MQLLKTYYNRDNKVKWIMLVWACTGCEKKIYSQGITYELPKNKIND
jgi:hypothetical protein